MAVQPRLQVRPVATTRVIRLLELLQSLPPAGSIELDRYADGVAIFHLSETPTPLLPAHIETLLDTIARFDPALQVELRLGVRPNVPASIAPPPARPAPAPAVSTPRPPSPSWIRRWWLLAAPAVLALIALAAVMIERGSIPWEQPTARDTGLPVVTATAAAALPSAPPPTAAPEPWLLRNFAGRCLPASGRSACDPLRAGLWAGDLDAWTAWSLARGEPRPTAAQALARTVELRLAEADPAARVTLARGLGAEAAFIGGVRARPENGALRITAVELVNLGARAVDVAALELVNSGARVALRGALRPDIRCVIDGARSEMNCPVTVAGLSPFSVKPGDKIRLLAADGRELDTYTIPDEG